MDPQGYVRRRTFFQTLAAFALGMTSPARAEPRAVIVFAAASLKNALDAIDEEWHREIGKSVTAAYAASSTLAKQIENGAPADLFISADPEWMRSEERRVGKGCRYGWSP